MADFPNANDYLLICQREALAKNVKITLDAVQRDGADAQLMLAAGAAGMDEVTGQIADVAAGAYLDSSRGLKLDKLVFDRYGLLRKQASPAYGTVAFACPAPNPTAFTIPIGTQLSTPDAKQFVTIESAVFAVGSIGPVYIQVRSVLSGGDQQTGKNQITSIVSTIAGAVAGLTVNNTLATSGADNVEGDPALRDRARRFWSTARRGTNSAIETGALTVPGVRTATAYDVIDASGRPARMVLLMVTDAYTDTLVEQGVNPPAYQAQSQALAGAVFDSLDEYRAGGIYVQVIVAKTVLLPILLNLRFRSNTNTVFAATAARAIAAAKVNELAPGQVFDPAAIVAALRTLPELEIFGDEVVSPAGIVIPAALEAFRTTFKLVSANVNSGNLSGSVTLDQLIIQGNVSF